MKKKRANGVPYLTKTLRKAVLKRFELERKYLRNRNQQNMGVYESKKRKFYFEIDINERADSKYSEKFRKQLPSAFQKCF